MMAPRELSRRLVFTWGSVQQYLMYPDSRPCPAGYRVSVHLPLAHRLHECSRRPLCNRPHPTEVDRGSERAGGTSSPRKLWLVGGMDHNQIVYWIVIN